MRSRSSVVAPGRRPWSRSDCRTQWRSVSPEQPIFSAIELMADYCEGCSDWWSSTIRTARARTSGEYGGTRFVMAPSSQELEPPENPVRFTHYTRRFDVSAAQHSQPDLCCSPALSRVWAAPYLGPLPRPRCLAWREPRGAAREVSR